MTRKYKDRYRSVKSIYPDVYKLPEEEIQPMTNIVRYQGNTEEETKDILNKYIKEKEPFWKEMCYLDNDTEDKNQDRQYHEILKPLTNETLNKCIKYAKQIAPKKLIYPNEKELDNQFMNVISPAYAFFDTGSHLYDRQKEMERNNIIDGDNYYHPLAYCEIGQKARKNLAYMPIAMVASSAKEIYDFGNKIRKGKTFREITSDISKDLSNNSEGFWHGFENPQNDCREYFKYKLD